MILERNLIGDWQLRLLPDEEDATPEHTTLTIQRASDGQGWTATLGGAPAEHWHLSVASGQPVVEFACQHQGSWEWYKLWIEEAVLAGRFARSAGQEKPPTHASPYPHVVTGWNQSYFDRELTPRVYQIVEEARVGSQLTRSLGTLTLDSDETGRLLGRYRIYAVQDYDQDSFRCDEGLEYEVEVLEWNGTQLCFTKLDAAGASPLIYTAQFEAGQLKGAIASAGTPAISRTWSGTRIGVLSYGFCPKPPLQRRAWQTATRRMLKHLMMASDPTPQAAHVRVLRDGVSPATTLAPRDDNPARHPQRYRLSELEFQWEFVDRHGRHLERRCHAWLAVPTMTAEQGQHRAVLCLNGHKGSAYSTFFPGADGTKEGYWYGDAFARRGYVVLAIDISHRPPSDRRGLYVGYEDGDDPLHGNRAQPAIKHATDRYSEWEEAGERAWDILRAHDYLRTRPDVQADQIMVAGLSMGGEMAILAGALDPRLRVVVAGGYPPDVGQRQLRKNHECWQWQAASMGEYIDVPDLQALIAPRGLVVQTSTADRLYSDDLPVPLASAKQLARRTRAAYRDDQGQFVHYLHGLRLYRHEFCVGDVNPAQPGQTVGIEVPCLTGPSPADSDSFDWQTDTSVRVPALGEISRPTLLDYVDYLFQSGSKADD